jgi:class 3 adenylate cyclase
MTISGSTNVVRMLFTNILYLPLLYAHLFQLGTAVQIALLSLGLAYRLRLQRTEREKSERLLRNVLPHAIAERLKSGERSIAERFDHVSVLFADIVGFTSLASQVGPEQIVAKLNTVFSRFDELSAKYGLEKIKTIGDCYMVVGGVPLRRPDHLESLLAMALEMLAYMRSAAAGADPKQPDEPPLHVRIGIHTGPAVAGVIGTHKFAFDLWGDTVNTASRMESHGEPDRIQCTPEVYERMQHAFVFEERGEIEIKGKGRMRTYFLISRRGAD